MRKCAYIGDWIEPGDVMGLIRGFLTWNWAMTGLKYDIFTLPSEGQARDKASKLDYVSALKLLLQCRCGTVNEILDYYRNSPKQLIDEGKRLLSEGAVECSQKTSWILFATKMSLKELLKDFFH